MMVRQTEMEILETCPDKAQTVVVCIRVVNACIPQ